MGVLKKESMKNVSVGQQEPGMRSSDEIQVTSNWNNLLRAIVVFCATVGAAVTTGCNDQPVDFPPCINDTCPDVGDNDTTADLSGDATAATRSLNFYVTTADGDVLKDNVTTTKIVQSADMYPGDEGVQVDVVVQTVNVPAGSMVEVLVNNKVVGTAVALIGDTATVSKITIPCATVPVSITARATLSGAAAEVVLGPGKSIDISCGGACTAAIDPKSVQDCFTSDVDPATPGFQANFTVTTTTPECSHAFITVADVAGKVSESEHVSLGGGTSASVRVTLAPDATGLINAKATIQAQVEDKNPTQHLTGVSPNQILKLTTENPQINVTNKPVNGQLTRVDDKDQDPTNGIQYDLIGTVTTLTTQDKGAIEIFLDGISVGTVAVQIDGTFNLELTFKENKAYSIKIVAVNGCGLSGSINFSYAVFVTKATLILTSPADNSTLFAKDDADPATTTIYDATFIVDTTTLTADSEVAVFCRKSGVGIAFPATPVGTIAVADITVAQLAIAVTLDVDILGQSVVCMARDNAPNQAQSPDVTYKIALPPPCLTALVPAAEVTVITAEVELTLKATNLDGATATAQFIASDGTVYDSVALGAVAGGGLSTKVALQSGSPAQKLPDGVYTLVFDAVDGLGNHANVALCSDITRTVTLDTTPPTLALLLPSKATLTALDDLDSDAAKLGYQAEVTAQIGDAKTVCLYVGGAKIECQNHDPSDTLATFKSVTLQPGANELTLDATDVNGNKITLPAVVIALVADVPTVKFVSPPTSLLTPLDSLTFVAKVTDKNGDPVNGADHEVRVNDQVAVVAVIDNGDGTYTFTVDSLSAGVTTVQFGAWAPGLPDKAGYSSVITVTFKNQKPTIGIISPLDGAVFNLANVACSVGLVPCVTKVLVTTVNAEDGSKVAVNAECGGVKATYSGVVANNAATVVGVSLANQATCAIDAQVTDLAGQDATSTVVGVSVDRTAPVLNFLPTLVKSASNWTLLTTDDLDGDAKTFMQVNLQLSASGLPKDAVVQCDAFDDTGKKTGSFLAKNVPAISDTAPQVINFGVVTLPDGFQVKLQCSAADAAGNPVIKAVIGQILSAAAEIRIVQPLGPVATDCTANAQCGANAVCVKSKCISTWNKLSNKVFNFVTFGMPNGATIKLCSDAPGVVGAPCNFGGGYKLVASSVVTSGSATLNVSSLADGTYNFMAEGSALGDNTFAFSVNSPVVAAKSRTILLDVVAPQVGLISPPSDASVPAKCLSNKLQSQADAGAPGGKFLFTVTTTNEEGTVSLLVDSGAGPAQVGSAPTKSLSAAIAATIAGEGAITVSAVAVDVVGNISAPSASQALTVNTVPPTGSFAAPTKAKLIVGDSLGIKVFSASTDVEGQTVSVKDNNVAKGSTPFVAGNAVFLQSAFGILSEGAHSLTADLVDNCGNTAVAGTVNTLVDTKPPVLAFTSPAQAKLFGDADDAAPAKGGYQVSTVFSTTDAASWVLELGFDCDVGFANCGGFAAVSNGAVTNPGGAEPPVLVTIPFGKTENYSLRVTGTDANGNTTAVQRGFQVKLSGCIVQMTGLPPSGTLNTQQCAAKGQNCASVTVSATATFIGPCGTPDNIQFLKDGAEVGKKVPVTSAATFDVVALDGKTATYEAVALQGAIAKGSTGGIKLQADLTNPVVAFAAGTVLGQATVAGPSPVLVGKNQDGSANAGHQAQLKLQIDDAGLAGGKLTALTVAVNGGPAVALLNDSIVLPASLNAASVALDGQNATLQQDASNVLTATVQDALGNIGTVNVTVNVDWTPPSGLILSDFVATDLNSRRPVAKLHFTATGDNAGIGKATSYNVRYSKKPIVTADDFKNACDAKALPLASIPTPSAAGAPEVVIVSGPDPRAPSDNCKFVPFTDNGLSKYYFAVEAVDAAGNAGALSNVLNTSALALHYAKILPTGAYDKIDFRSHTFNVGDLDADGLADVGVGGTNSDLCVIYGRKGDVNGVLADIDLSAASGPNHICIPFSAGLAPFIAVPHDVNGDGVVDLVTSAGTGALAPREVRVYLGVKAGKIVTVPAVTMKNIYSPVGSGIRRPATMNFNGDTTPSGAPLYDIAAACGQTGTFTYDRVFVIPGSQLWSNASPKIIDLANAGERAAANIATIHLIDSVGIPNFGGYLAGLGNTLPENKGVGTQYDELAISQLASPQQVAVVHGRAPWVGELDISLTSAQIQPPAKDDASTVRIFGDFGVGVNNFGGGIDAVEFDGKSGPDLVVQHQNSLGIGALFWIRASALQGQEGKAIPLTRIAVPGVSGLFTTPIGYASTTWISGVQTIGNFFDNPLPGVYTDIMHGRSTVAPGGTNAMTIRGAFVHTETSGEIGFPFEDLYFGDPFVPGSTNWGTFVAFAPIGDFNGDGLPDLIIGSNAATAAAGSTVLVY